jgi:acetate kinase
MPTASERSCRAPLFTNRTRGDTVIYRAGSAVAVYVIPTDEEATIAAETCRVVGGA